MTHYKYCVINNKCYIRTVFSTDGYLPNLYKNTKYAFAPGRMDRRELWESIFA